MSVICRKYNKIYNIYKYITVIIIKKTLNNAKSFKIIPILILFFVSFMDYNINI